jgi:hypothetical protein
MFEPFTNAIRSIVLKKVNADLRTQVLTSINICVIRLITPVLGALPSTLRSLLWHYEVIFKFNV